MLGKICWTYNSIQIISWFGFLNFCLLIPICYGFNDDSQSMCLPLTCKCDSICKNGLTDVIKLGISRRDHPGSSGWTLNPKTSVLIRRREDTDREDHEKKQSFDLYCHKPRNTRSQKLPKSWKKQERILSWNHWRKYGPSDTLILDFWHPKLLKQNFFCFKPPSLW